MSLLKVLNQSVAMVIPDLLTGLSFGSTKNILMITSNSPHPVSVISKGGLVTAKRVTEKRKNKNEAKKRQIRKTVQNEWKGSPGEST